MSRMMWRRRTQRLPFCTRSINSAMDSSGSNIWDACKFEKKLSGWNSVPNKSYHVRKFHPSIWWVAGNLFRSHWWAVAWLLLTPDPTSLWDRLSSEHELPRRNHRNTCGTHSRDESRCNKCNNSCCGSRQTGIVAACAFWKSPAVLPEWARNQVRPRRRYQELFRLDWVETAPCRVSSDKSRFRRPHSQSKSGNLSERPALMKTSGALQDLSFNMKSR